MARRSYLALSVTAAGACLALCACGAGAAPGAGGTVSASSTTSSPASAPAGTAKARLTGHFCTDASDFMRNIPAAPATRHVSETQARASMSKVLKATVRGFTGLEKEAPASLHASLHKIVRIYQKDEKALRHSATMAQISESMVRGNAAGSIALQHLLRYIGQRCE
jgi:uncharacterized membrane protein YdfJ with MMPL/SSD domain